MEGSDEGGSEHRSSQPDHEPSPAPASSNGSSQATLVAMSVGIAAIIFVGGLGVFVLASPTGPTGRVTILPSSWTADWVGYNASYGVSPPIISAPAVGPGFCPSANGTYPSGSVLTCWFLVNLTQTGRGEDEIGGLYVNLTAPFYLTNVLADWDHFCLECYSWDLSIQLPPQPGTYALGGNVGLWGGPG
jgi:hypothetical protein